MKQLKFMLAAATAIGLATAAQAATKPLENEDFDTYSTDKVVTEITGFSFDGENKGDNESAIIEKAEGDKALQVNTGTDPLLRQISDEGSVVNLTNMNHLIIETLVQFTVTPWSDKDNVTPGSTDKLMIYLQEDLSDAAAPVTNLVVKAGYLGENLTTETYELDLNGLVITNNVWYKLKVCAYANVGDPVMATDFGTYPGFSISVGPEDAETLIDAKIANGKCYSDAGTSVGPFVFNPGSPHGAALEAGKIFLSRVNNTELTHVGFAGEGMIDDFVVTKDYEATTVDFTFTWTTDGISAVKYAIGDATEYTPLGEDKTIADLDPEATIKIQIVPAEWYAVKEDADLEYTASEESAELDDLVTVVTTKVDPDTGDVVVNPGESVTVADIQAAAGITKGAFFAEGTTKADLEKALTWKNKNNANGKADINEITFSGVEPTSSEAEAYLLNCDPQNLESEKDKFKLTITFDKNGDPVVNGPEGDATYKNGNIVLKGREKLSEGNWADKAEGHKFFKAVLTK